METEIIPEQWAQIHTRMIHKKDDEYNPANYRPICTVNTTLKVFTQIILTDYRFGAK